jgi:hypothetical protein
VSLVIAAALLAGCSTVYRRYEFERRLAANTASWWNCPASKLEITPVGDAMVEGTDLPVYLRVEGCRQSQVFEVKAHGYEGVASTRDPGMDGIPQCGMAYEKNWGPKHSPRKGP